MAVAVKDSRPYYQFQARHLDILMAHGWFRMGRYMFTVNHIGWHRETRVFWVRYYLPEIRLSGSASTIMKRSERFEFRCRQMELTEELTELFLRYRKSVSIDTADSLEEVLYRQEAGKNLADPFPSMVVEMRDKGKLIGAGIFDAGENSIMGIVNFFLPEYRKFSPGKSLMLKKMEWASENKMLFYYPGYIAARDQRFDYKLFAGSAGAELFDPLMRGWIPFEEGMADSMASIQKNIIRNYPEPLWLNPLQAREVLAKFG